jgi:glyoxylase-like metal-dependent hydrolase (beta-lactamase superfamily II)
LEEGVVQIREVVNGIFVVGIPVPFPMGTVNCVVARSNGGWAVVDAGYGYPPAREAWEECWSTLGINAKSVSDIYITHYHVDHLGLAAWLQRRCGARVWMSPAEIQALEAIWSLEHDRFGVLVDFFRRNGTPDSVLQDLGQSVEKVLQGMERWERLEPLANDGRLSLGGHIFRVLVTPGHTPGHVCLYSEEAGIIIAGDHVLPRITPNVSLWPESSPQPLADYLRSLYLVRDLPVRRVLPSHGEPFEGLAARVDEILLHHRHRLEAMETAVGTAGATAWEVSQKVFGEDLDVMDQRFALTETLAHLEYLVAQGRLVREEGEVVRYFRT